MLRRLRTTKCSGHFLSLIWRARSWFLVIGDDLLLFFYSPGIFLKFFLQLALLRYTSLVLTSAENSFNVDTFFLESSKRLCENSFQCNDIVLLRAFDQKHNQFPANIVLVVIGYNV